MQDDLFNDKFKIEKMLMGIEFCKKLVKHDIDFMSDYYRVEFEEKHITIAEGIIKTDQRFKRHLVVDIFKDEPEMLKIWKLCVSRSLIRTRENTWKEGLDRKLFKDNEDNKYLFSLIFDTTTKLYGWEG